MPGSEQQPSSPTGRSKWLWTHTSLRVISFLAGLAAFIAAIYGSAKYNAANQFIGCFVAAAWILLLDGALIAVLVKNTRLRLHPGLLAFVELLTVVLCAAAPILISLYYGGVVSECGGLTPQECDAKNDYRTRANGPLTASYILLWIAAVLHFIFVFLACISRCSP